jgi:hypothetical protein
MVMAEVGKCTKKTQGLLRRGQDLPQYGRLQKANPASEQRGISHDAKRAERAVREIAGDFPDDSSTMTLGDDPLDWHFVLGDEVQDKIVVRYIFEVPKDKDMGKESDAIAGRVFDMAEKLAELAGYFIWERKNYEPR